MKSEMNALKQGLNLKPPPPKGFPTSSFRLPDLHCFVEIKKQELTEEEEETACLLTLVSGKPVYVFFGSPRSPDHRPNYSRTYKQGFTPEMVKRT